MIHFITSSGMRLFLDLLKVAKSKGSNVTIRLTASGKPVINGMENGLSVDYK